MAPYTYYYSLSTIAVLGIAYFIMNLIYLRARGRTTFGLAYKPESPEYKRGQKIASNRNLIIAAIVAFVFIANLINSIVRVVHLGTQNARLLLVVIPVVLVIFFAYMNQRAVKQFGNYDPGEGGDRTPDRK
jgi:cobalamin synthase